MKTLHREILCMVSAISPFDVSEKKDQEFVQKWIESGADIFRIKKPKTPDIHLVSYFLLLDQRKRQVLLVDHKKAKLWLPSGGHVEPNEHPNEHPKKTVEREVIEELGIEADFLFDTPRFLTSNKTEGPDSHTDVSFWYLLKGDA